MGAEFCLLTEWKKEDLLSGRKYIYEVLLPKLLGSLVQDSSSFVLFLLIDKTALREPIDRRVLGKICFACF